MVYQYLSNHLPQKYSLDHGCVLEQYGGQGALSHSSSLKLLCCSNNSVSPLGLTSQNTILDPFEPASTSAELSPFGLVTWFGSLSPLKWADYSEMILLPSWAIDTCRFLEQHQHTVLFLLEQPMTQCDQHTLGSHNHGLDAHSGCVCLQVVH